MSTIRIPRNFAISTWSWKTFLSKSLEAKHEVIIVIESRFSIIMMHRMVLLVVPYDMETELIVANVTTMGLVRFHESINEVLDLRLLQTEASTIEDTDSPGFHRLRVGSQEFLAFQIPTSSGAGVDLITRTRSTKLDDWICTISRQMVPGGMNFCPFKRWSCLRAE